MKTPNHTKNIYINNIVKSISDYGGVHNENSIL